MRLTKIFDFSTIKNLFFIFSFVPLFSYLLKTENTAVYGPLGMFQLHYSGSIFSREIRVLVRE